MASNILKNHRDYDIVIKGAYGAANFGDDALLYSLLNNIASDKNIAVIGKENEYISSVFPRVDFYSYNDDFKLDTKILLWGGGTQFYDFRSFKLLIKKMKTVFLNPNIVFRKICGKQKKGKINFESEVYLSIGFGPFSDSSKEKKVAEKLGKSNKIFVRDNLSYSKLTKYLDKSYIEIVEDICLLDKDTYLGSTLSKNKRICIIIRDWDYDSSSLHVDEIINFYLLSELKDRIDFILFAKDSECIRKLKKNNISYIQWDPLEYSILEFSNIISQYDLIISSRYHGVIFGLIHSIPTIAIEIEPKLSQVSKDYSESVYLWGKPFNGSNLSILINSIDHQQKCMEHKINLKNVIRSIEGEFCE